LPSFRPGKTPTTTPKAKCTVPRLKGQTLFDAVIVVIRAHCTVRLSYSYSSRVPAGRVAAQKPKAGTKLRNGGRITIVLSKGPRRKPR